jgi:hypothetical protein
MVALRSLDGKGGGRRGALEGLTMIVVCVEAGIVGALLGLITMFVVHVRRDTRFIKNRSDTDHGEQWRRLVRRYFSKASPKQLLHSHAGCSRGNSRSRSPSRTMPTLAAALQSPP